MATPPPAGLDPVELRLLDRIALEIASDVATAAEMQLIIEGSIRSTSSSVVDAAIHESAEWRSTFREYCQALGVNDWPLDTHPPLVLPDYRFGATARLFEGRTHILINKGCFYLVSFLVESMLYVTRLYRSLPNDSLTAQLVKQIHEPTVALANRYLSNPFPLPEMRRYMDDEMNVIEGYTLASAELFIYFHEVAHIELGHLGGGFGASVVPAKQPAPEDEFAADRWSYDLLESGGNHCTAGALMMFDCLSLLEASGWIGMDHGARASQRRKALDACEAVGPWNETYLELMVELYAATSTERLLSDFSTGCEFAAEELGIPVRTDKVGVNKGMLNLFNTASALAMSENTSASLTSQFLDYMSETGNDASKKRAYLRTHPDLLSRDMLGVVAHRIHGEEDSVAGMLMSCETEFLARCKEVGVDQAMHIHEVFFNLLDSSFEESMSILERNPHVFSECSHEYITHLIDGAMERHQDGVSKMVATQGLIYRAHEHGIGVCRERGEPPPVPDEVSKLELEMTLARRSGDLRRQVDICRAALELARREKRVPIWSLPFKEELDRLPDF